MRPEAKKRLSIRLAVACGAAGAAYAIAQKSAPPADIDSLASLLGDAAHGVVLPSDVRWEPSRGAVADVVVGRWAVFLAAESRGAPRDVWRARVRVTPEGRPLAVAEAHDLTGTPLGDDHALVMQGQRAAFATFAYGQEQSVTALDLAGEGDQNRTVRLADRVMSFVTNVQQTGSGAGVGRVDLTLEEPARAVGLALDGAALDVDLEDGGKVRHARLDLARGELAGVAPGMHAEGARHLPKRFVFWAVDTVRAVPWIGPAPIAWLEDRVFALRDDAKQLAFKMHGERASETLATGAGDAPAPAPLDASQAAIDAASWPPEKLGSMWKTPEPGEGEWVAPKMPWMRKIPTADATTPPAFVRTFVRPDQDRPYSKVLLVAMDMRQLDLDMEAGLEDPKPLTGPHGNGRIPRDPKVFTRVAGAFNGAFKTEHGNYGMMVHKRVLLPPQPSAATVIVLKDGRVGLGTWSATSAIGGLRGIDAESIVSYRQNLDALLDQGEINPTKRALWGYTLPGNGAQTERSGLCVTQAGHLMYAWGDDVNATSLAKAMRMAGCAYGMHLDMNPHHTGFTFTAIDDLKARKYHSEVLSTDMEIYADRYIEYAAKDFFYVLVHDPTPAPVAGATWAVDAGAQPAPTWMPALWSARFDASVGDAKEVELLDVEAGRATFRIRAGAKEPDAKTGATPLYDLRGDDAHRVLFTVGLGTSGERHPGGLGTDGKMVLQVGGLAHDGHPSALLVAREGGALAIAHESELGALAPHTDVAELPLLFDGAKSAAPVTGARASRAALGITDDGRVILARGNVTSDAPLDAALRAAGCTRAVLLDRGAHQPVHLDRAGTASAPRASYDETTLFAIATPMKPRAFRFEPDQSVAQARPARTP